MKNLFLLNDENENANANIHKENAIFSNVSKTTKSCLQQRRILNQDSKYSKNRVVLRACFTLYYTVRFSIETGISVNLNY